MQDFLDILRSSQARAITHNKSHASPNKTGGCVEETWFGVVVSAGMHSRLRILGRPAPSGFLRVIAAMLFLGLADASPTLACGLTEQPQPTTTTFAFLLTVATYIIFQYLLWHTITKNKRCLSRIVISAIELPVVLSVLPAFPELGVGGGYLEITALLVCLAKLFLLFANASIASWTAPPRAHGGCSYCGSESCDGTCGQGSRYFTSAY